MNEVTINGYVATDRDGTRCIYIENKPVREMELEVWNAAYYSELPDNTFPEITWESEPVEVEITIKLKN